MYSRYNRSFSIFIKSYPITCSIVLVHLCLYIILSMPFIPHQSLYKNLVGVNLYISEGDVWRLLTPMFIHLNFAHFFYNTLSIVIMGPLIESILGKCKFALLYLLSGLAGNSATFIFLPLTYTHAGSSGAIFGLLGCFILFVLKKKFYVSKQNQVILLLILGISAFMTIFETDINVTAHTAGLFTGLLCGWLFLKSK